MAAEPTWPSFSEQEENPYRVRIVNIKALEAKLNDWYSRGWEMVDIIQVRSENHYQPVHVVLKRRPTTRDPRDCVI